MTEPRRFSPLHSARKAPRRRAAPFLWRLVIMVKAPVAGRVKTRLARGLGVVAATRVARVMTRVTLHRMTHNVPWKTTIAVAPDTASRGHFPPRIRRVAQGPGDLGARMQRIMVRNGLGPVVVVGADIPSLAPAHVREAFRQLGRHDAVFGPATDGGYWLVGLKRRQRLLHLFQGVRWSTRHALSDTLRNLKGASVAMLGALPDVDDAADVRRCGASIGRVVPPAH